jgi:hypothetical protein
VSLAGGFITISRQRYAAGLFWQPVSAHAGAREMAAKIARTAKIRASFFVSFNGMVGLSGRGGAHSGKPAAAAEVIEFLGEKTFLAAVSVREGVWLLAARGGIIIKDRVFENVAEAQREYAELNAMPDWNALIAPAEWNAPSAVERRISDSVTGNKKHRLSSISHLPAYIITLVMLAAAGFAGYSFFREPIKKVLAPAPQQLDIDPEIAAEYKKKLEQIDAPKPAPPPKEIHVPIPYESLPDIEAKADQCWRAIAFLSQQITGWVVDSAVCVDGEANAHLLRNHGTIGGLRSDVAKKMPNVLVDETGGNDVILTAKLKALETSDNSPQHSADEIMTAVQSVFQQINEDVGFARDFAELKFPELGENEIYDTDMTEVPVVKIDASSKLQPLEFIKVLGDAGSVQIPLVKWDNRNRNWIYEVLIYVK